MMIPTRPVHNIFQAPFHRNITRPAHVDWMLQETYNAILFSKKLQESRKGLRIFVSLVVKQELVSIYLHKDDGFQTVPLQAFFKPIQTEVSFWSKINNVYDGGERRKLVWPRESVIVEIDVKEHYFQLVIENDWYKSYE
ncbi:unnamed protein product [Caenorhabditis brenneri]